MKKEYVRQVVVFEEHFKEFRKTLDRETLKRQLDKAEALMKKYFELKRELNNGPERPKEDESDPH